MMCKLPVINTVNMGKYNIGSVVNNLVITMDGVRWLLDLLG